MRRRWDGDDDCAPGHRSSYDGRPDNNCSSDNNDCSSNDDNDRSSDHDDNGGSSRGHRCG